ncbi:MAG: hypothetical protein L6Q99_06580 [Planctomycetes bacterium]|nr:hypothetical protein [Planctomycetota bacterium]
MHKLVSIPLAATVLAALAPAQSFNLDVGDNLIIFPVPQNSYVGAAAQAGVWNSVKFPYSTTLVQLDGSASTVTTSSNQSSSFNWFPSTLTGDDYNFMVDIQDVPFVGGPWSWTFSGLTNGDYALYTYAFAPENNGMLTRVTVTGSSDPAQDVGGIWSGGAFVQGVTHALHHVTVTSGQIDLTVEGLSNSNGSVNGFQIVYLGGGGNPFTTYCTAKTASVGCVPTIGASGTPSSILPTGCPITCANVINNKNSLLFYGVNGPSSLPFQGGTLCVKGPIKRTNVLNSGGNPPPNDCSGALTFDFNVLIASGSDPLLVAGQQVNAQWWFRDPGFSPPDNTGLSNGVEFVIQ